MKPKGPVRKSLGERFWPRVSKGDGCWEWIGRARSPLGYGAISRGGHQGGMMGAHRASWILHYGSIPEGMGVLHRCDNPSCVRPDHLFLGTQADNMRDCVSKGRKEGEEAGMATTLQEFADKVVAAEYKQPLKTVREACDAVGWVFEDHPKCCGQEAKIRAMFGDAYFAQCETCGKFIVDVTGPSFSESGSSVSFIDRDKFPEDTDWTRCWIAGTEQR